MLWLQGWDKAPEVAQACRTTWEERNPGWEVRALSNVSLLEQVDVMERFDNLAGRWVRAEHFADLARLALLERHGGVWVDATAYCARPLDEWLDGYTTEGFFALSLDTTTRIVANWFLASSPRHPLVAAWADAANAYWAGRDVAEDYHWPHVVFTDLYRSDEAFRRTWDLVPRLSAAGPHHFVPYPRHLLRPLEPEDLEWVNGEATPLLKLTHKVGRHPPPPGSVLEHLCDGAGRLRSPSAASRR